MKLATLLYTLACICGSACLLACSERSGTGPSSHFLAPQASEVLPGPDRGSERPVGDPAESYPEGYEATAKIAFHYAQDLDDRLRLCFWATPPAGEVIGEYGGPGVLGDWRVTLWIATDHDTLTGKDVGRYLKGADYQVGSNGDVFRHPGQVLVGSANVTVKGAAVTFELPGSLVGWAKDVDYFAFLKWMRPGGTWGAHAVTGRSGERGPARGLVDMPELNDWGPE